MKRTLHNGTWFCLLAVMAGCGAPEEDTGETPGAAVEKVSHQRAALMVATNTETALMGLTNAGGFLADSTALAETLNELGGSSESCSASSSGVVCPADGSACPAPVIVETCTTDEVTPEDLEQLRADMQESIQSLVEELQTRFFSVDNVESEEDKVVTYLLGPEDLCGSSSSGSVSSDGTVTETEPTIDAECADRVTRAQVRLRVTSPAEGDVDVTVLLTEERYEPLLFELHQDRLAVTADLDQLAASVTALGEDLGGVESIAGRLQLELVKNTELDYSFSVNVLDALSIVVNDEGERLEASLAASSPTMAVRVDGNAGVLTASYDYGALRVAAPLSMFADMFDSSSTSVDDTADLAPLPAGDPAVAPVPVEPVPIEPVPVEPPAPVYTGTIEALLAGLSGSLSFAGNTDMFNFTNLGLGDETSTLKHDGNTLLAVDLNAAQGRRFDLTVQNSADGVQLTFSPTFDLSVLLNFAHIADQIDVDGGLLDDVLHFWFDGQSPSLITHDDGIEVVSGTLHMTSSAAPDHDLEVTAGMCLFGAVEDEPMVDNGAPDPAAVPVTDPVETPVEEPTITIEESNDHFLSSLEVGACE